MEETQKCQYLSITDIQKEYLPISRKKITDVCEKVSGCKDDRKSYLCQSRRKETLCLGVMFSFIYFCLYVYIKIVF